MKTETNKAKFSQLQSYAAMAAAFVATAGSADAAIVYTDLDPDQTAVNSNVLIDMDGDGTWDFRAEQSGYNTGNSTFFFTNQITRLRGNMASGPAYGWVNNGFTFQAAAMNSGDIIGPASPITPNDWATCGAYRIFSSAFSFSSNIRGDWVGAEDKYFGVRFSIGGNTHYGWINATITPNCGDFVVHGWAYEDSPGVAIAAGDVGSSPCTSAVAPQNPLSTNGATGVTLSWDVVSGSVGCRVQGSQVSPPGGSGAAIIPAFEATSFDVPYSALPAGSTWIWQVACACTIAPLDATPLSAANTFTVPAPRLSAESKPGLFPNPAVRSTALSLNQPVIRDTEVSITNALGQEVDFIILPADASTLEMDISALSPGLYFVQVGKMEAIPLEVN